MRLKTWGLLALLIAGFTACRRSIPDGPLFPATIGSGMGFIDPQGHTVIHGPFENVRAFSEGRAAVSISKRWGYIDRTGTVVIPAVHRGAQDFHGGVAIVDTGLPERPYGLMDSSGTWVIQPSFRNLQSGDATGDYFLGQTDAGADTAFYDRSGRRVFGPFRSAFPFSEGHARVSQESDALLTSSGTLTLQGFSFDSVRFSEGVIAARQDKKLGYVNDSGLWMIPGRWEEGGDFKEGLAPVRDGMQWFFIDHSGTVAAKLPENVRQAMPLSDGRSLVTADRNVPGRKFGYVDRTGQWVVQPVWDDAEPFENGLARVGDWRSNTTAYIDLSGKIIWKGRTP